MENEVVTLTEEEYTERFVKYIVDAAGEDARAYAEEVASSYYGDGIYSPEDDAETDMSYWE